MFSLPFFRDADTSIIFINGTLWNHLFDIFNTILDSLWFLKSHFLCPHCHHNVCISTTMQCSISSSSNANIGTFLACTLFQKNPWAHISLCRSPQCHDYLMMCEKLFQILISVLDLVPKSCLPLTIAWLCLAIVNGTQDLETMSKTLTMIWNMASQNDQLHVFWWIQVSSSLPNWKILQSLKF